MNDSVLSFVMSHVPDEWDDVNEYSSSYILFTLDKYSREYRQVEAQFPGAPIARIQRVQNPFQFGRFLLRREMLHTTYDGTVFHGIHRDDLDLALKFNCDYRRYTRKHEGLYENGKHPNFYNSFSELLNTTIHPITDIVVLVMKILTNNTPQSQCDYYIQYIVKF